LLKAGAIAVWMSEAVMWKFTPPAALAFIAAVALLAWWWGEVVA
jgi:hypothetical protein